ncbi:Uncharacterised protein [Vibrio cholerae]|nr:Uncharacterised protein [Vibrio cholerae]
MQTHRINHQNDAAILNFGVTFVDGFIESKAILEAATTTTSDVNTQH